MVPTDQGSDLPQFSRPSTRTEGPIDLRGECPRHIANVLDAVSLARNKHRFDLVNEILGKWAEQVLHETSLVNKLTGINPADSGATGRAQQ